jgi:hypothetical protein
VSVRLSERAVERTAAQRASRRQNVGREEGKIKGLIFFDLKSLKALRMWG